MKRHSVAFCIFIGLMVFAVTELFQDSCTFGAKSLTPSKSSENHPTHNIDVDEWHRRWYETDAKFIESLDLIPSQTSNYESCVILMDGNAGGLGNKVFRIAISLAIAGLNNCHLSIHWKFFHNKCLSTNNTDLNNNSMETNIIPSNDNMFGLLFETNKEFSAYLGPIIDKKNVNLTRIDSLQNYQLFDLSQIYLNPNYTKNMVFKNLNINIDDHKYYNNTNYKRIVQVKYIRQQKKKNNPFFNRF